MLGTTKNEQDEKFQKIIKKLAVTRTWIVLLL